MHTHWNPNIQIAHSKLDAKLPLITDNKCQVRVQPKVRTVHFSHELSISFHTFIMTPLSISTIRGKDGETNQHLQKSQCALQKKQSSIQELSSCWRRSWSEMVVRRRKRNLDVERSGVYPQQPNLTNALAQSLLLTVASVGAGWEKA